MIWGGAQAASDPIYDGGLNSDHHGGPIFLIDIYLTLTSNKMRVVVSECLYVYSKYVYKYIFR